MPIGDSPRQHPQLGQGSIGQAELDNWFTYHPPVGNQQESYLAIREAAKLFAEIIVTHTPPSADQTFAIRLVRLAVMVANQSIACDGR